MEEDFTKWELTDYVLGMNMNKTHGYDKISRKSVKLLFLANPMVMMKFMDDRFKDSDDVFKHISKIAYLVKEGKTDLDSDGDPLGKGNCCL